MRTVITLALFLTAFSVWLGTVAATGQYRRARLGPAYRAEQDGVLWLTCTLTGVGLVLVLAWITPAMP